MVFDINQLGIIRKRLSLTQHKFAKFAGVSQSLIAKIEAGKLDPTYSKVKKIEEAINRLNKQKEKSASQIMNSTIITCKPYNNVKEVIKTMLDKNISQIPVVDGNAVTGLMSEALLLDKKDVANLQVRDIMEEPPPTVSASTKMSILSSLLKFYPIVVVVNKGQIAGVVTKADLLNAITY